MHRDVDVTHMHEIYWMIVSKQLSIQGLIAQAFLPLLGTDLSLKGQPGRIVNVTSVQGKVALPLSGAYGASKHALEGMSESLRRELIPYGIDVIIFG